MSLAPVDGGGAAPNPYAMMYAMRAAAQAAAEQAREAAAARAAAAAARARADAARTAAHNAQVAAQKAAATEAQRRLAQELAAQARIAEAQALRLESAADVAEKAQKLMEARRDDLQRANPSDKPSNTTTKAKAEYDAALRHDASQSDLAAKQKKLGEAELADAKAGRAGDDPSAATLEARSEFDAAKDYEDLAFKPSVLAKAKTDTQDKQKAAEDAAIAVARAKNAGEKPSKKLLDRATETQADWMAAIKRDLRGAGASADARGADAKAAIDDEWDAIVKDVRDAKVFDADDFKKNLQPEVAQYKSETAGQRKVKIEYDGVQAEGAKQLDEALDALKKAGDSADADLLAKVDALKSAYGYTDAKDPSRNVAGSLPIEYAAKYADIGEADAKRAYQALLADDPQRKSAKTQAAYSAWQDAADLKAVSDQTLVVSQDGAAKDSAKTELDAAQKAWDDEKKNQPGLVTAPSGRSRVMTTTQPEGYDATFWVKYDPNDKSVQRIDGHLCLVTRGGHNGRVVRRFDPIAEKLWEAHAKYDEKSKALEKSSSALDQIQQFQRDVPVTQTLDQAPALKKALSTANTALDKAQAKQLANDTPANRADLAVAVQDQQLAKASVDALTPLQALRDAQLNGVDTNGKAPDFTTLYADARSAVTNVGKVKAQQAMLPRTKEERQNVETLRKTTLPDELKTLEKLNRQISDLTPGAWHPPMASPPKTPAAGLLTPAAATTTTTPTTTAPLFTNTLLQPPVTLTGGTQPVLAPSPLLTVPTSGANLVKPASGLLAPATPASAPPTQVSPQLQALLDQRDHLQHKVDLHQAQLTLIDHLPDSVNAQTLYAQSRPPTAGVDLRAREHSAANDSAVTWGITKDDDGKLRLNGLPSNIKAEDVKVEKKDGQWTVTFDKNSGIYAMRTTASKGGSFTSYVDGSKSGDIAIEKGHHYRLNPDAAKLWDAQATAAADQKRYGEALAKVNLDPATDANGKPLLDADGLPSTSKPQSGPDGKPLPMVDFNVDQTDAKKSIDLQVADATHNLDPNIADLVAQQTAVDAVFAWQKANLARQLTDPAQTTLYRQRQEKADDLRQTANSAITDWNKTRKKVELSQAKLEASNAKSAYDAYVAEHPHQKAWVHTLPVGVALQKANDKVALATSGLQSSGQSSAELKEKQFVAQNLAAGQENDPKALYELFMKNPEVMAQAAINRFYANNGSAPIEMQGRTQLRNTVAMQLGFAPSIALDPKDAAGNAALMQTRDLFTDLGSAQREMVDKTVDRIVKDGGEHARVTLLPIVYATDPDQSGGNGGIHQTVLFQVEGKDFGDAAKFVDEQGMHYDDLKDYRANNTLPVDGVDLVMPEDGKFKLDDDGNVKLFAGDARTETGFEHFRRKTHLDAIVGGIALVGGVLLAVGSGGTLTAVSVGMVAGGWSLIGAASVYGAVTSADSLANRSEHGLSINPFTNREAGLDWLTLGASVLALPGAGSSLRVGADVARLTAGGSKVAIEDIAVMARNGKVLQAGSRAVTGSSPRVMVTGANQTVGLKAVNAAAAGSGLAGMADGGDYMLDNWDRMSTDEKWEQGGMFALNLANFGVHPAVNAVRERGTPRGPSVQAADAAASAPRTAAVDALDTGSDGTPNIVPASAPLAGDGPIDTTLSSGTPDESVAPVNASTDGEAAVVPVTDSAAPSVGPIATPAATPATKTAPQALMPDLLASGSSPDGTPSAVRAAATRPDGKAAAKSDESADKPPIDTYADKTRADARAELRNGRRLLRVGMFDSGSGGIVAARDVRRVFKEAAGLPIEVVVVADHSAGTYGNMSKDQIAAHTRAGLETLDQLGCDIIVMACNTACTSGKAIYAQGIRAKVVDLIDSTREFHRIVADKEGGRQVISLSTKATADLPNPANPRQRVYEDDGVVPFGGTDPFSVHGRHLPEDGTLNLAKITNEWLADESLKPVAEAAVEHYVREMLARHPDMKVMSLDCTHYPALKELFRAAFDARGRSDIELANPMDHQAKQAIKQIDPTQYHAGDEQGRVFVVSTGAAPNKTRAQAAGWKDDRYSTDAADVHTTANALFGEDATVRSLPRLGADVDVRALRAELDGKPPALPTARTPRVEYGEVHDLGYAVNPFRSIRNCVNAMVTFDRLRANPGVEMVAAPSSHKSMDGVLALYGELPTETFANGADASAHLATLVPGTRGFVVLAGDAGHASHGMNFVVGADGRVSVIDAQVGYHVKSFDAPEVVVMTTHQPGRPTVDTTVLSGRRLSDYLNTSQEPRDDGSTLGRVGGSPGGSGAKPVVPAVVQAVASGVDANGVPVAPTSLRNAPTWREAADRMPTIVKEQARANKPNSRVAPLSVSGDEAAVFARVADAPQFVVSTQPPGKGMYGNATVRVDASGKNLFSSLDEATRYAAARPGSKHGAYLYAVDLETPHVAGKAIAVKQADMLGVLHADRAGRVLPLAVPNVDSPLWASHAVDHVIFSGKDWPQLWKRLHAGELGPDPLYVYRVKGDGALQLSNGERTAIAVDDIDGWGRLTATKGGKTLRWYGNTEPGEGFHGLRPRRDMVRMLGSERGQRAPEYRMRDRSNGEITVSATRPAAEVYDDPSIKVKRVTVRGPRVADAQPDDAWFVVSARKPSAVKRDGGLKDVALGNDSFALPGAQKPGTLPTPKSMLRTLRGQAIVATVAVGGIAISNYISPISTFDKVPTGALGLPRNPVASASQHPGAAPAFDATPRPLNIDETVALGAAEQAQARADKAALLPTPDAGVDTHHAGTLQSTADIWWNTFSAKVLKSIQQDAKHGIDPIASANRLRAQLLTSGKFDAASDEAIQKALGTPGLLKGDKADFDAQLDYARLVATDDAFINDNSRRELALRDPVSFAATDLIALGPLDPTYQARVKLTTLSVGREYSQRVIGERLAEGDTAGAALEAQVRLDQSPDAKTRAETWKQFAPLFKGELERALATLDRDGASAHEVGDYLAQYRNAPSEVATPVAQAALDRLGGRWRFAAVDAPFMTGLATVTQAADAGKAAPEMSIRIADKLVAALPDARSGIAASLKDAVQAGGVKLPVALANRFDAMHEPQLRDAALRGIDEGVKGQQSHLDEALANLRGTAGPKAVGSSMLFYLQNFVDHDPASLAQAANDWRRVNPEQGHRMDESARIVNGWGKTLYETRLDLDELGVAPSASDAAHALDATYASVFDDNADVKTAISRSPDLQGTLAARARQDAPDPRTWIEYMLNPTQFVSRHIAGTIRMTWSMVADAQFDAMLADPAKFSTRWETFKGKTARMATSLGLDENAVAKGTGAVDAYLKEIGKLDGLPEAQRTAKLVALNDELAKTIRTLTGVDAKTIYNAANPHTVFGQTLRWVANIGFVTHNVSTAITNFRPALVNGVPDYTEWYHRAYQATQPIFLAKPLTTASENPLRAAARLDAGKAADVESLLRMKFIFGAGTAGVGVADTMLAIGQADSVPTWVTFTNYGMGVSGILDGGVTLVNASGALAMRVGAVELGTLLAIPAEASTIGGIGVAVFTAIKQFYNVRHHYDVVDAHEAQRDPALRRMLEARGFDPAVVRGLLDTTHEGLSPMMAFDAMLERQHMSVEQGLAWLQDTLTGAKAQSWKDQAHHLLDNHLDENEGTIRASDPDAAGAGTRHPVQNPRGGGQGVVQMSGPTQAESLDGFFNWMVRVMGAPPA